MHFIDKSITLKVISPSGSKTEEKYKTLGVLLNIIILNNSITEKYYFKTHTYTIGSE